MGLFNFLFLSTPSARRATFPTSKPTRKQSYFYPRPPRGGRPGLRCLYGRDHRISIHALREEGDPGCAASMVETTVFLSTPSARRATCAVCGRQLGQRLISIHALREEGDASVLGTIVGWVSFLSTPSARRATGGSDEAARAVLISIHALREEGDTEQSTTRRTSRHFYPRPPRGGRPQPERPRSRRRRISIHALREEGDSTLTLKREKSSTFLSTPSARRATLRALAA